MTFRLDAATFVVRRFRAARRAPAAKPAAHSEVPVRRAAVDVAALKGVDSEGEVTVGTLTLADGGRLEQVHVRLTLLTAGSMPPYLAGERVRRHRLGHLQIDAALRARTQC